MSKQFEIDDVTARQYKENWDEYQAGTMSVEDWTAYAVELTNMIMEKNKDNFIRMLRGDQV